MSRIQAPQAPTKSPLWLSHRFGIQVMAALVFMILAYSGKVSITGDQLLVFVLTLAGLGVSARTVTGVTGILASTALEKRQVQLEERRQSCPPCQEETIADRPNIQQMTKEDQTEGTQPALRLQSPPFPPLRTDDDEPPTRRKLPQPPVVHKGGF